MSVSASASTSSVSPVHRKRTRGEDDGDANSSVDAATTVGATAATETDSPDRLTVAAGKKENEPFKREVIQIDDDEEDEEEEDVEESKDDKSSLQPAKKRKIDDTAGASSTKTVAPLFSSFVSRAPSTATAAPSTSTITFNNSPYWTYFPRAVPSASESKRFYEALKAMVDPVPGTIFVYGKHHVENRLTKVFARHAGSFKYSGTEKVASGEWPKEIEELYQIAARDTFLDKTRLAPELRGSSATIAAASASSSSDGGSVIGPDYWDTVLINFYRDGNDSISWHSDKDSNVFPIASFSFGAEREFQIRERPKAGSGSSTKHLKFYSGVLASGSLLLMHPGMQQRYHHSVPKRKGISQGRVNVTFRLHHRAEADKPIAVRA